MPTTKNALTRYHALDRCFQNPGRNYDAKALLEACNDALKELDPESNGIKKRQLYADIRFMESEQGWNIDLQKSKNGRSTYYRYADTSFSINKQPINELEAEQLKSAMLVLSRFKGLPQFGWVSELLPKLDQTFNLSNESEGIISFDSNQYLKGLDWLDKLFNAVLYKQTLQIRYQSFRNPEPVTMVFFPYHLKQYNSRWFLLGRNKEYTNITNLALDRILEISDSAEEFQSTDINFDEYFEDVIGVTVNPDIPLQQVVLKVTRELAPYIDTKPMHESQKPLEHFEDHSLVRIKVCPNYELEKLILSFGENLEVLEPAELREKIAKRILNNMTRYDACR